MRYRRFVVARAALVLAGNLVGLVAFIVYWFVLRPEGVPAPSPTLLRGLLLFVALGLVLGAAGAILLSLLVQRSILRPLRELEKNIETVAEGTLSVRARPHFLEEADSLSGAFNQMAEKLARRFDQLGELARQKRDLELAAQIQATALPERTPVHPRFELAAAFRAVARVTGDFHDFIQVSDRRFAIMIGDVAATGLEASIQIVRAQSIVRAQLGQTAQPAQVLTLTNRALCRQASSGAPVALFCAVLDLHEASLVYANAGHPLPVVRYGDLRDGSCGVLDSLSAPLGVSLESQYREQSLVLSPGDALIMYSDGLVEALNQEREKFGAERLERLVSRHSRLGAEQLVERILGEVDTFVRSAERTDDISLLALKIKGDAPGRRIRRLLPRRKPREEDDSADAEQPVQ